MEADLRHAELIVKQLGLEHAKALTCPVAEEPKRPDDEIKLNRECATQYKSLVARANYLAQDRPDIMFAAKEICRHMAKPTTGAWKSLKRLGRHLITVPRRVFA